MQRILLKTVFIFFFIAVVNKVFAQHTGKILVVSSYNITEQSIRKNKKELFYQINDSLLAAVQSNFKTKQTETKIIYGYSLLEDSGEKSIYELIKKDSAAYAVVINSFDVSFDQSEVEKTQTDGGNTSKTAHYNICSLVKYSYYNTVHLIKAKDVNYCEPHLTRSVISGLFATGPNIVSNKKDAFIMAAKNVKPYFDLFFPGN